MPLQSRRISLSSLGIDDVAGMRYGNHLRIGFDPRRGFPECGFALFKRQHRKGTRHVLDVDRLFVERLPALLRHGWRQGALSTYHEEAPRPERSDGGGIALDGRKLAFSFRPTPFSPDSIPKICEVRIRLRANGRVVAEAFDDRHDGTTLARTLVARASRESLLPWLPGLIERILEPLRALWSSLSGRILEILLGADSVPVGGREPPAQGEEGSVELDLLMRRHLEGEEKVDIEALLAGSRSEPRAHAEIAAPAALGSGARTDVPVAVPVVAAWRRSLASIVYAVDRALDASVFSPLRPSSGEEHVLVLEADLISLVEVSAPAGSRLLGFESVKVSDQDWRPYSPPPEAVWSGPDGLPMLLPVAEDAAPDAATYRTCPQIQLDAGAGVIRRDLPVARLESGFVAQADAADVFAEYADLATQLSVYLGPEPERARFEELGQTLDTLQSIPPGGQLGTEVTDGSGADDESASYAVLPLLLTGGSDASFARLLGLAFIDPQAKDKQHFDYKVVARWNGIEHAWITHDLYPGRDGALLAPDPPQASAVADPTRTDETKTNVELQWQAPGIVARLDRARRYLGYHVFRRLADPSAGHRRLTESKDDLSGVTTPDLLLLAEVQGNGPVVPPPADTGRYVDRPPEYGRYDYGIQAEDLFGRRSEVTWIRDVPVPVLVDPPPVSELYAYYLDPSDPEQAGLLEPRAAGILEATSAGALAGRALLVEFRYPRASIDAVAGDVARFELSYRHGRPNELTGLLSDPVLVGPSPDLATSPVVAEAELATVTPVPADVDGFAAERSRGTLVSRGEHFVVESATRLDTHRVRLRVGARRDYLPRAGEAVLGFGRGGGGVAPHPSFRSPRDAGSWTGVDLRHPQGAGSQGALRLSGSDDAVLTPLPVDVDADRVLVSRSVEGPANPSPADAGGAADWLYRVVIEDVEIPLPAGLPAYPGAVTVQVVSGHERRSELPAPAVVQRRAHEPPAPFTALASGDFQLATRPDFEGRIGVRLTWPEVAGVQAFNVYRATGQRLLRARGGDPALLADPLESSPARAEIKRLGGELASLDAFTLVTPVPVTPGVDPRASHRHRWVDRFPAPRDEVYVYRVQPIDALGHRAPWPADSDDAEENRDRCVLVLQRNRNRLLAPSVYALEPLDRAVAVEVRLPGAASVVGLRIYKTDAADATVDVRRMTLIHGTLEFDHPRIETIDATDDAPARARFVDDRVQVGVEYFYRVVFVDTFGNVSLSSEALAVTPRAFAPPPPPVLTALRTSVTSVQLTWQAEHGEGEVKPQRRRSGESLWRDVTDDWLAPSDEALDTDARGACKHRVLLRDPRGRLVYSDSVLTEA